MRWLPSRNRPKRSRRPRPRTLAGNRPSRLYTRVCLSSSVVFSSKIDLETSIFEVMMPDTVPVIATVFARYIRERSKALFNNVGRGPPLIRRAVN